MIALSLGWGTQSFTLAAMSALGEIHPTLDVAIHADTTFERESTYRFAEKYTPWLEMRGLPVVTLTQPRPQIVEYSGVDIPAYTRHPGGRGVLHRQCTRKWKIVPMRRWFQANRKRQPVELWIGISLDEASRMKPSNVQYITHRWPLVELHMTRQDCEAWLRDHDFEIPEKSSCVFCPYHSSREWINLKARAGAEWETAVQVDHQIRHARPPGELYIHRTFAPLEQAQFLKRKNPNQMSFLDECEGFCGG